MSEAQIAHTHGAPVVGVLMGSSSDWEVMKNAVAILPLGIRRAVWKRR